MQEKTAIFPGTFNPFTRGHLSIVERGLKIFDRVVVAIGYNEHKTVTEEVGKRLESIRRTFAGNPRVEAAAYTGLTVDFAKAVGACAILRGVRNVTDFEYERNLADVNQKISGIETILLFSLPEDSFISGSNIRELEANGYDVSEFLPERR